MKVAARLQMFVAKVMPSPHQCPFHNTLQGTSGNNTVPTTLKPHGALINSGSFSRLKALQLFFRFGEGMTEPSQSELELPQPQWHRPELPDQLDRAARNEKQRGGRLAFSIALAMSACLVDLRTAPVQQKHWSMKPWPGIRTPLLQIAPALVQTLFQVF